MLVKPQTYQILRFFCQFIKHPHLHERGDEGLPPQNVHAYIGCHLLVVVDSTDRALTLTVSHVATTGFQ